MQARIRSLALAALSSALFTAPTVAANGARSVAVARPDDFPAGPPWISIELPVNPYDQSMRGAFLLVHAFHHQTPVGYVVTGTAEGIVNGERRSLKLEFTETSPDGAPAAIRVPTMQRGSWTVPAPVSMSDIDAALRARAATLARRS